MISTGSTAENRRAAIVQHRLVNLVSRKFEEVILEEVVEVESSEQSKQNKIKLTKKVDAKLLAGN